MFVFRCSVKQQNFPRQKFKNNNKNNQLNATNTKKKIVMYIYTQRFIKKYY